jgi:hypothetical protein
MRIDLNEVASGSTLPRLKLTDSVISLPEDPVLHTVMNRREPRAQKVSAERQHVASALDVELGELILPKNAPRSLACRGL